MEAHNQQYGDELRRLFRRGLKDYGGAYSKYGEALAEYGSGNTPASKVVEVAGLLLLDGAFRTVDFGKDVGLAYVDWLASLVGVTKLSPTIEDVPDTAPPRTVDEPKAATDPLTPL
jgi:hypothetical protein